MLSLTALSIAVFLAAAAPPSALSAASTPPPSMPSSIPATGAVPTTPGSDGRFTDDVLAPIAHARDDASRIRQIRREYFANAPSGERAKARRAEGLAKLAAFTDPAAMVPMYAELRHESNDVVTAVLDHFQAQREPGQAALAWVAINDEDERLRNEATRRIARPASPAVLGVIDNALRSNTHMVANRAGALVGSISALQAIPLLIFAQATRDRVEKSGDLAWIAIGTQTSYVANVVPVVGNNTGAFQPAIGVINSGVLLRVTDAVVVTYRTEIHTSLVNLTSADWGQSTESFGYDMHRWYTWFNDEYVPFKKRQAEDVARLERARKLEREAADEDA